MTYTDYRFKFSDLTTGLNALSALATAGLLDPDGLPENMLGDPRDAEGNVVSLDDRTLAWKGGRGTPAGSYVAEDGTTVAVPPLGDGASWYVHIRSVVPEDQLPIDPSEYGMSVTDPAESAEVLGVWA